MKLRKLLGTMVVAAALAVPLQAQTVVYDNGGPNGANGNEMAQWIQAENFTFAATTTFNQIRFWDFEFFSDSYNGQGFNWWIFANNVAQPGAILFSGTVTNPTRTAQGTTVFGPRFQNDLLIGDITLGAGMYWVGLHMNGPYDTRRDIYWETTDPTVGNGNESFEGTMDNWFNNGQEHAFQLLGEQQTVIPEPATLSLFAMGLAGMAAARRRRRSTS